MEHGEGSSTGGTTAMTAPAAGGGNTTSQPAGEFGVQINKGFSSKNLAEFKPRNTEPLFKSPTEFSHEKPLVDITKQVDNPQVENHEFQPVKTENQFNVEIKTPEIKSMFKDINNFGKQKPLIDINKPVSVEPVEIYKTGPHPHEKIEEAKTEEQKTPNKEPVTVSNAMEEKASQPTHEIESEQDVQIDMEPKAEQQTHENSIEMAANSEPEVGIIPQTHPKTEPEVSLQTQVETITQKQEEIEFKTQPKTEVVPQAKTEVATNPLTQVEVEVEVSAAQDALAATLAQQETVSLTEARAAIATAVKQEQVLERQKEVKTEQKQEQKKKENTLEEKAKEMFLKRKKEKQDFKKSSEQQDEEEGILYFDKDNEVNTYREMAALAAAERLNILGHEVTGAKLAKVIAHQIEEGEGSEIVEGIQDDESGKAVVEAISKMEKIENSWTLRRVLRQITDRFTAVKLVSESRDGAEKHNAEKVYGRELDGVTARFEEENTTGQMKELKNGQVVYITSKPPQPLPVAPGEISQSY